MNKRTISNFSLFLSIIVLIFSCDQSGGNQPNSTTVSDQKSKIEIFNFSKQGDLGKFNALKLDDKYYNLLNPQISGEDFISVRASWTDLHQRIGDFLKQRKFDWGVKDSSITIVQKFYFQADGHINYYFFNIRNDSVTDEKREEFGSLIYEFAVKNKIYYSKDEIFAQCGKTRYMNY